jgi:hypothetical protein
MAGDLRLHTPRAQRFPLQVPLHYRKKGMLNWQEARTLNISRTGILFHTDESLPLNSTLDIRVYFPSDLAMSCQGSIVRCEESTFAIRIHRYHLRHAQPVRSAELLRGTSGQS